MGAAEAADSATAPVSEVPKTATYMHAYAQSNGFLTLLSDGERLTGAYALGPEAWSGRNRRRWPSARTSRARC